MVDIILRTTVFKCKIALSTKEVMSKFAANKLYNYITSIDFFTIDLSNSARSGKSDRSKSELPLSALVSIQYSLK